MFDHNDFDEYATIPGTNVQSVMELATQPLMIAHDQEPLQYNLYTKQDLKSFAAWRTTRKSDTFAHPNFSNKTKIEIIKKCIDMHLRSALDIPINIYDQVLLCHSEKNSSELTQYEQNGFVGVYWWSHAMIAQDWYRYAQHDKKLKFDADNIKKDFLVYNRAWCGSREYRLKFTELVVEKQLHQCCNMKFNPVDGNSDYRTYQYKNPNFKPSINLEDFFDLNLSDSGSSGDYHRDDYVSSGMEVVLETMFDDQRWHLTEKALRPIACGKPFILVSTPGILNYLKSYGFKTFDSLIDESYDLLQDPVQRLHAVTDLMKTIRDLPVDQKRQLWTNLQCIADYNKNHFFSSEFRNQVINEYKQNLQSGLDTLSHSKKGTYYYWYKPINIKHGSVLFKEQDMQYIESVLNSSSR